VVKTLLILILLTYSLSVHAWIRYEYPILCDKTEEIIKSLIGFKEEVKWQGKDAEDKSIYSLWISESGGWTLLKMNPEVSCVLGVGEESVGSDRVSWKLLFMRN
jgi:hypothetical protein